MTTPPPRSGPAWLVTLEVGVAVVAAVDVAVSPRIRYARHRLEITDVASTCATG